MPSDTSSLIDTLNELLENSINLKSALIKRDLRSIQSTSDSQEEILNRLQSIESHLPLSGPGNAIAKIDLELRKTAKTLASRIRTVQRTNKTMASAFLTIINRTFTALCTGGNGISHTYSASGNADMNISSILVQQQG